MDHTRKASSRACLISPVAAAADGVIGEGIGAAP
jgi:hypothetical protein